MADPAADEMEKAKKTFADVTEEEWRAFRDAIASDLDYIPGADPEGLSDVLMTEEEIACFIVGRFYDRLSRDTNLTPIQLGLIFEKALRVDHLHNYDDTFLLTTRCYKRYHEFRRRVGLADLTTEKPLNDEQRFTITIFNGGPTTFDVSWDAETGLVHRGGDISFLGIRACKDFDDFRQYLKDTTGFREEEHIITYTHSSVWVSRIETHSELLTAVQRMRKGTGAGTLNLHLVTNRKWDEWGENTRSNCRW